MKNNVTIRMSAAHWDATVRTPDGSVNFDFRRMTKDQRRTWIKTFVAAFRQSRA